MEPVKRTISCASEPDVPASQQVERLAGSAVRQDGLSASLTAPNGRAQQQMLTAVLMDASMQPACLQLVESAANGSKLGDPIEVGAIATVALPASRTKTDALLLASVKANVGHTESASGVVGLAKLLCTMRETRAAPIEGGSPLSNAGKSMRTIGVNG